VPRHLGRRPDLCGIAMPSDSLVRRGLLVVKEFPNGDLQILGKLFTIAHKFPDQVCYSFIRDNGTPPRSKAGSLRPR
jgi:hypothetical protein